MRNESLLGDLSKGLMVRLLLDRARDLIIHGPARRGANGAAMPTYKGDQDLFFRLIRCLGARSHCYCCLDPPPPTEEGGGA